MKQINKPQFMRRPSVVSNLQPGKQWFFRASPVWWYPRPKEPQMAAQEIEQKLQELAQECPEVDTLA